MSGWVCSYRTIWSHPFFKGNGMRVAVWHWLLHHAAWKATEHTISGVKVTLQRGEVCFSQQQIQDETGATRKQVREVLGWLVSNGKAAKIRANDRANGGANVRANARTILRIEKYEEYQAKRDGGANGGAEVAATDGPTKEQVNKQTTSSSEEAGATAPEAIEVSVLSKAVWDAGKPFLASRGINNPGAIIGKWLKTAKPIHVLEAIGDAQKAGTQDPIPYITQILNGGHGYDNRNRNSQPSDRRENRSDPALEQIARLTGIGQASSHAGGGIGGYGEEDGPLRMGAGSRYGSA